MWSHHNVQFWCIMYLNFCDCWLNTAVRLFQIRDSGRRRRSLCTLKNETPTCLMWKHSTSAGGAPQTKKDIVCMLVCVMISISLPGVHFLHVRHRCGWVVVSSVTHLDLSHFLSALSGALKIIASSSQSLAVYHKITWFWFVHIAIKSRVFEKPKCALNIRKFYSWRN